MNSPLDLFKPSFLEKIPSESDEMVEDVLTNTKVLQPPYYVEETPSGIITNNKGQLKDEQEVNELKVPRIRGKKINKEIHEDE